MKRFVQLTLAVLLIWPAQSTPGSGATVRCPWPPAPLPSSELFANEALMPCLREFLHPVIEFSNVLQRHQEAQFALAGMPSNIVRPMFFAMDDSKRPETRGVSFGQTPSSSDYLWSKRFGDLIALRRSTARRIQTGPRLEFLDLTDRNPVAPAKHRESIEMVRFEPLGSVFFVPPGDFALFTQVGPYPAAIASINHVTCTAVSIRALDAAGRAVLGHAHLKPTFEDPLGAPGLPYLELKRAFDFMDSKGIRNIEVAINVGLGEGLPDRSSLEKFMSFYKVSSVTFWERGNGRADLLVTPDEIVAREFNVTETVRTLKVGRTPRPPPRRGSSTFWMLATLSVLGPLLGWTARSMLHAHPVQFMRSAA